MTSLTPRQQHRRAMFVSAARGAAIAACFAISMAVYNEDRAAAAGIPNISAWVAVWIATVMITLIVLALTVGRWPVLRAWTRRARTWLVMKHRARWRRPDREYLRHIETTVDEMYVSQTKLAAVVANNVMAYARHLLEQPTPFAARYAAHAIAHAPTAHARAEEHRAERAAALQDVRVALLPMRGDSWAPFRDGSWILEDLCLVRSHTLRGDTTHVAIYETAPTSAIVALAIVDEIRNTYRACEVDLLAICHVDHDPVKVQDIGIVRAPQSVQYLTPEQVTALDTRQALPLIVDTQEAFS
jgi:hypothetical protein